MGLAEKTNFQAFEAEASPDYPGSSATRTAPRFVLNRGKGTESLYPHVEPLLDTGWHGNRGKAAHFGHGQSLRGRSCEVSSQHSPQLGTGVWVLKRGSGRCTTDSIFPVRCFRLVHSLSLTSKFTPSGGLLQNSVVSFPRKLPRGSY